MELLTTSEAADRLGVTVGRIQQLIWSERLPAVKVGRDYVIKEEDLALVADRKPGRPAKSTGDDGQASASSATEEAPAKPGKKKVAKKAQRKKAATKSKKT